MNPLHDARIILQQHSTGILRVLEQHLRIYLSAGAEKNRDKAQRELKRLSSELVLLMQFFPDRKKHAEADRLHKICVLLGRPEHASDTEERMQLLTDFYRSAAVLGDGPEDFCRDGGAGRL